MAIASTKKGNLVDQEIPSKVENKKSDQNLDLESSTPESQRKSKGFLKTTFIELKKVNWPTFGYTLRWSLVIIFFTILFSIVFGYLDHVFEAGINFIDCTSDKSRSQSVQSCSQELTKKIILQ